MTPSFAPRPLAPPPAGQGRRKRYLAPTRGQQLRRMWALLAGALATANALPALAAEPPAINATRAGRLADSQGGAARSGPIGVPAAAPAPEPIVDSATEVRLGQRLRCPVCQGMSIGDSPSPMAQDMMRQVRKLHAEGASEQAIVAHFTARYGDWVLLDPPRAGFGLWVWLLPPLALLAGVMLVWQRAQRAAKAPKPPGPSADLDGSHPAPAATGHVAPASADDGALLAQIRKQVDL